MENEQKLKLKKKPDPLLTKLNTIIKYNLIDFYNDDIYIELKLRRNTYQKYNSTIIGSNKINYLKTLNKKCYFVFCYLDGLYYI